MFLTARKRAPPPRHYDTDDDDDDCKPLIVQDKPPRSVITERIRNAADDSTDSEVEQFKPDDVTARKVAISENFIFLAVIVFLAVFITAINMYNINQLERLKEEHGHGSDKVPELGWWEHGAIYLIYPRSFQDTDGDGVGDIKGIQQRLDYVQSLGVDKILLAPIYPSPMLDFGHDVTDFQAVDPTLGSMEDFTALLKDVHKRGMKLLLDMVPNHSSNKHPWFEQSRKGLGDYSDYYTWHSGRQQKNGTLMPPSNWLSRYSGSAWTWDHIRKQYYLHQFDSAMPDLNYRNPKVRAELVETARFWLKQGVDGFRIRDCHLLFESEDVSLDEPDQEMLETTHDPSDVLDHMYTVDQPEVHEITSTLHELMELHGSQNNKHLLLLVDAEGETSKELMRYYYTGADAPTTYNLLKVDDGCGGECIQHLIENWIEEMPDGKPIYWMTSMPYHKRVATRKGPLYSRVMSMLSLTLPGSSIVLYGDELGMTDLTPFDSWSRRSLVSRAVMPWNTKENGGFTLAGKPWIPVSPDHKNLNVESQQKEKFDMSQLQMFRKVTKLHKEAAFHHGKLQYAVVNEDVISFVRYARDTAPYLVSVNVGKQTSVENYMEAIGYAYGKVAVNTGNFEKKSLTAAGMIGSKIHLQNVTLKPGQGIIVKLDTETFYEMPLM